MNVNKVAGRGTSWLHSPFCNGAWQSGKVEPEATKPEVKGKKQEADPEPTSE